MFTGLVEECGYVVGVGPTDTGLKLQIQSRICGADIAVGDSLAVNGCCLTIVKKTPADAGTILEVDLLDETWHRTNLQFSQPGHRVNLERALRADARLGGHFVTGHIDGMGKIVMWEPVRADRMLRIETPPHIQKYIIPKGSIAVDGISLTVAEVHDDGFTVWIIPHTFEVTALCQRRLGDAVNLEGDLLGKYAEKILLARVSG